MYKKNAKGRHAWGTASAERLTPKADTEHQSLDDDHRVGQDSPAYPPHIASSAGIIRLSGQEPLQGRKAKARTRRLPGQRRSLAAREGRPCGAGCLRACVREGANRTQARKQRKTCLVVRLGDVVAVKNIRHDPESWFDAVRCARKGSGHAFGSRASLSGRYMVDREETGEKKTHPNNNTRHQKAGATAVI